MLNRTKNNNRYDKYKDSDIEWIVEIPEHWNVNRGKNVLALLKREVENNMEVITCFRDGQVTLRSNRREDGFTFADKECGYQGIFVGDLVIHGMDGFAGAIGISDSNGKGSPVLNVCSPKNNYSVKYICYYLRMLASQNIFVAIATGIRERSCDLRWQKIANLLFILPIVNEQKEIADYLDKKCGEIDRVVETQKNIIEKLKEYKQSVITEAVTKGLDKSAPLKDSGIEWIGKIPESWEVYKIKHCVIFNPTYSENLEKNTPVSFAPMECLTNCNLDCKETTIEKVSGGYTYFAEEDVIMAKVTPCFENGNIAIAKNLLNKVGFGTSELYVFRAKNINNKFLLYFLQNRKFKDLAISTMYGTGGLKRVSADFVKNYKFGLPTTNDQKQIADYLDKKCSEIDSTISNKEQLIDKLTEYKKSLIYECVTGKRKVIA